MKRILNGDKTGGKPFPRGCQHQKSLKLDFHCSRCPHSIVLCLWRLLPETMKKEKDQGKPTERPQLTLHKSHWLVINSGNFNPLLQKQKTYGWHDLCFSFVPSPGNCWLGRQINPNSWCYLALRQSHSAPSCHSLTALVSPLPFKATKVLVLFQTRSWHLMHDRPGAFCPVQRKTDTQFLIIVLTQLRVIGVPGPHQVTIGSYWFYSRPLTNCHVNYC